MPNETPVTLNGLLMMLGNVQHENFHQMREMMVNLYDKVKSIDFQILEINRKLDQPKPSALVTATTSGESLESDSSADVVKTEITGSSLEIFCFDCQKKFVRGSGEFSRHVKTTSCKPYQCHCGKLFKKKSSLTAHESTHSTAAYACECGAIFRCEQYLRNHKRRKHQLDSLDCDSSVAKISRLSSVPETVQFNPELDQLNASFSSSISPIDLLKLQMQ